MNPHQLAIHTMTNQPWSIYECLENYARKGIGGISIWRETLAHQNLQGVARHLKLSGLQPVSLVRGGFFTGSTQEARENAFQENLRAIDEAYGLGLQKIVLVCGATVGLSPKENREQILEGILRIIPDAEAAGIELLIEPLHPMYAGDRSAICSLKDARDLAQEINHPLVKIAVDVFHVWWDQDIETQIAQIAREDRLSAFHACEFKPDFEHPLLDRGLPGEGVRAAKRVKDLVFHHGFDGLVELEIFSRKYWAMNQHDFLDQIIESCKAL